MRTISPPPRRASGAAAAVLAVLALTACSTAPGGGSGTPGGAASSARTSQPGSAATNPAPGPSNVGGFDAAHAAQVLSPSVGLIIATTSGRSGSSEGSGFVFTSRGGTSYMLTNNHVVQGAGKLQVVMPDGRHYVATVQGTDALEDIGVLKINDTLPVAQFADSTRLQVGQPVVAIGSPLGSQGFGTVTTGVISALHRTLNNVGGTGRSPETLADV